MTGRHAEGAKATIDKHDGNTDGKGFTAFREAARGSAHDHHFLDPSQAPMKLGLYTDAVPARDIPERLMCGKAQIGHPERSELVTLPAVTTTDLGSVFFCSIFGLG